jgi:hypothetical protein
MRKFFRIAWLVITAPFRLLAWLVSLPVKGLKKMRQFLVTEPEERPIGETLADTLQKPATLLEHLDALRKHFARILIGLLICVAVFFFFTPRIVNFFALPI